MTIDESRLIQSWLEYSRPLCHNCRVLSYLARKISNEGTNLYHFSLLSFLGRMIQFGSSTNEREIYEPGQNQPSQSGHLNTVTLISRLTQLRILVPSQDESTRKTAPNYSKTHHRCTCHRHHDTAAVLVHLAKTETQHVDRAQGLRHVSASGFPTGWGIQS